jgi:hypothetical protein
MPYKNLNDARERDRRYAENRRRLHAESPEGLIERQLRRTQKLRQEEIRRNSTIGAPMPVPATELQIARQPKHGLRIAVIPDTQVRPGVDTDHIPAAGRYVADKRPDVIVCIGDWWDMPSCSRHDEPGSVEAEGKRYKADVAAGCDAMEQFLEPIAKVPGYNPALVYTMGNHEDRIVRAWRANPRQFTGGLRDLRLEEYGWTVYPFLQPVIINGVAFCHYFPRGVMGRPVQSPRIQIQQLHMSSFAGHQQGREIAYSRRADGGALTAIISGSFYQHDEPYMSPLANKHWRGMWFLHEVKDGHYDEMPVSVNYLLREWKK